MAASISEAQKADMIAYRDELLRSGEISKKAQELTLKKFSKDYGTTKAILREFIREKREATAKEIAMVLGVLDAEEKKKKTWVSDSSIGHLQGCTFSYFVDYNQAVEKAAS